MASSSISSSALRLVASPKLLPNPSAFPSNASSFLCLSRSVRFSSTISFQSFPRSSPIPLRAQQQRQQDQDLESVDASLLPPKMRDIISLFQSVPEPKAKYQQLLHYGARLPPLDPAFKTDAHRVRGCVSQVWVRAFADPDDPSAVRFEADSDSALTKGLAALLVFGLSGSPATLIARVPPDFVQHLGLRQSLTPSRNNGFLNMLKLMQQKAVQLYIESAGSGESKPVNGNSNLADKDETSDRDDIGGRRKRIIEKLQQGLSPSELEVEDVSYLHAGHAGVRGSIIYDLLQEELQSGLHALSIDAKTPSEANSI